MRGIFLFGWLSYNCDVRFGPSVKVKDLKPLCLKYKIAASGRKAALQQRLQAFSRDRARWIRCVLTLQLELSECSISIIPGARRSHKGSKDSRKPSTRRRKEMFGIQGPDAAEGAGRIIKSSSTEIQEKLIWVRTFLFQAFASSHLHQAKEMVAMIEMEKKAPLQPSQPRPLLHLSPSQVCVFLYPKATANFFR